MKIGGIYKIINKTNGKYYVGSSVNVAVRISQHKRRLLKGIHENPKLQSAVKKYGIQNFEFVLVESVLVKENLLLVEQKYLDICQQSPNESYNLNYDAEAPRLGTKHTEKTKRQMADSQLDKTIYSFVNRNTNEEFKGRRCDFYRKFNLVPQRVYSIIKGEYSQHKGWTVLNT